MVCGGRKCSREREEQKKEKNGEETERKEVPQEGKEGRRDKRMEWNGHNPLAPQPRSRTQRLSPVHIRRQEARRERCIYQFSYPPPCSSRGGRLEPPPPSFISSISREPRILFRSHFGRPGRLDSAGQAKSWFSPRNPNLWSRSYLDSPLSLSLSLRRERGRGDGIGNPPSPISPLLAANVGFSKWEALVERHECLAPKLM